MACSQVAVLQDSLCVACNSQWKFTQGEEANLAAGSDEDTDLEGLIEESTAATMEELEAEPTSSPAWQQGEEEEKEEEGEQQRQQQQVRF
jgi:hypothetical protein